MLEENNKKYLYDESSKELKGFLSDFEIIFFEIMMNPQRN
ncbi:hypothetical protein YN1HA_18030 [Sulfurisphaera ohwakuensis]